MNQWAARPADMIWRAMIVSALAAALGLIIVLTWGKDK